MKKYFLLIGWNPDDSKGWGYWSVEIWMMIICGFIFLIALFAAVFGAFALSGPEEEVTCLARKLFGIYCPGCGGTHAVVSFFSGHIAESFVYNPVVPILIFTMFLFLVVNIIHYKSKGIVPGIRFHVWYLGFYAAVMLSHFVYINYMLLVKGIALIP